MQNDLNDLTEALFLSYPPSKRHRLIAKLLCKLYIEPSKEELLPLLHRLEGYLGLLPTPLDLSIIADQYHWHMARFRPTNETPKVLPEVRRLDKRSSSYPFLPLDIYLEDLRSGYNVGSIFRTTEAFRLGTLHLSPRCPPPTHKEVLKTALGATSVVPYEMNSSLSKLKRPLLALETVEGAYSYSSYNYPKEFSLLIGNEEIGLSSSLLEQADAVIEIPLYGNKNSLNVASAFAIIASHICRVFR